MELKVNNQNTVDFKEDIEYLLFTLKNCESTMDKHKDLSYVSQIWFTKDGYSLTFQAFKKENNPCINNDTQNQGI